LIIGGGEEAKDLYQGKFRTAIVLGDDWYSVNLKQVIVGKAGAITVLPPTHQSQAPTNAIVDALLAGTIATRRLPPYNSLCQSSKMKKLLILWK
jgi:hypothetical protein